MFLTRCIRYSIYSEDSNDLRLCQVSEVSKTSRRPDSLDIQVEPYAAKTFSDLEIRKDSEEEAFSLIRPPPDVVITPSQIPKSCGLVNPGFVFEFSGGSALQVSNINQWCLVDISEHALLVLLALVLSTCM